MKRLITLYVEDLNDVRERVKKSLKALHNGDEMIVLSVSDISYLFRGYSVEKQKEEGMWIIRVKRN